MDIYFTDIHADHVGDRSGDLVLNVPADLPDVDIFFEDHMQINVNQIINDAHMGRLGESAP